MNKELWLLRHGKSDRDTDVEDLLRPLTKRGKNAARDMGVWMRQQQLIPDLILSSPANRALSTATLAASSLGIKTSAIRQDPRLYFQGIEQIKAVLGEIPLQYRHILLVGHNPDWEDLLLDLAGSVDMPEDGKLMPTAALARLAMPNDWRKLPPSCARLLSITRARQLPDLL